MFGEGKGQLSVDMLNKLRDFSRKLTLFSLMLAGSEFWSLGRAIVKEDEYEEYHQTPVVEGGSKQCFRFSTINPKFSTTYYCEAGFSVVTNIKTVKRGSLKMLDEEMRVNLSHIRRNIKYICKIRQAHILIKLFTVVRARLFLRRRRSHKSSFSSTSIIIMRVNDCTTHNSRIDCRVAHVDCFCRRRVAHVGGPSVPTQNNNYKRLCDIRNRQMDQVSDSETFDQEYIPVED
ncbi:hypothetical protein ANN_23782 [Periplaneta americana]|uniref:Uncharacterized protein n=1 Tax=Periplaneta americana TaxID=6978 RepID=A0ABQ8SM26_PERAM|nr:hypothetical protein ANN_23782 [Periplaneta americana]